MALNRWSLDRLTAWIGTVAVLTLFVPMGPYLIHNTSSSAEQYLSQRLSCCIGCDNIVSILKA
jgi:hypothetical protein